LRPIERRAALHAALGDPVRLAIVDRLVTGDASPGELAEAAGLGSNVLAHHLNVVQNSGVIRRVRSEGDRRRSYVQLCPDDQTLWAAAQAGRHGPLAANADRLDRADDRPMHPRRDLVGEDHRRIDKTCGRQSPS